MDRCVLDQGHSEASVLQLGHQLYYCWTVCCQSNIIIILVHHPEVKYAKSFNIVVFKMTRLKSSKLTRFSHVLWKFHILWTARPFSSKFLNSVYWILFMISLSLTYTHMCACIHAHTHTPKTRENQHAQAQNLYFFFLFPSLMTTSHAHDRVLAVSTHTLPGFYHSGGGGDFYQSWCVVCFMCTIYYLKTKHIKKQK